MPQSELQDWMEYFEKRPLGWRADLRAYRIMASMGFSGKQEEAFHSLAVLSKESQRTTTPLDSLKSSYLFHKMMGAKGGKQLEIV